MKTLSLLFFSSAKAQRTCPTAPRRLRLEALEDRNLLTILVTNGEPDGAGSLREAITNANTVIGHETIIIMDATRNFSHIDLGNSALPRITDGVTIRTESGKTVFIHCEDCVGDERWGLFVEITESNRSKSVSFTDLEVANAAGAAFTLRGDELENATLADCYVYGSDASEGFYIDTDDATSIRLTDCSTFRASTGIWLEAGAHVDTLAIAGAEISASGWTPTEPTWYGIRCEGTGNVVIQDHIRPDDSIRHTSIDDIPGTGIYLNGHGTIDLQAQITDAVIGIASWGTARPITGDGIVVENWRGTIDPDGHPRASRRLTPMMKTPPWACVAP
jgi:hypothetical protein